MTSLMLLLLIFSSVVVGVFSELTNNLSTVYYSQTVDHFGDGPMTSLQFEQRVILDFSFIRSGVSARINGAPILVFLGGQYSIVTWIESAGIGPGILTLTAHRLDALIVYIEHRFYGISVPYGSIDVAMANDDVRGCLTSEQALQDFAYIINYLKQNLSSPNSPVIVMGESYGGMLAARFRLKYGHLALGALSSSTPVTNALELPVDDQYCSIVARDFKDTNQRCFDYIRKSWSMIDQIAMDPVGLGVLSEVFKTCSPLNATSDLKTYLEQMYKFVAEYNGRFDRLKQVCSEIARSEEKDILEGISRATFVVGQLQLCNNVTSQTPVITPDPDSLKAWDWQMCNEQLAPTSCSNSTMFEPNPFNLSRYIESCRQKYGANLQPNWNSTFQDLKSALQTNASNIIFSNGLKDPWSGASILQDISTTIVAVTTNEGFHSLDMLPMDPNDPSWLVKQRKKELELISKWIKKTRRFKMGVSFWTGLVSLILIILIICVKIYYYYRDSNIAS